VLTWSLKGRTPSEVFRSRSRLDERAICLWWYATLSGGYSRSWNLNCWLISEGGIRQRKAGFSLPGLYAVGQEGTHNRNGSPVCDVLSAVRFLGRGFARPGKRRSSSDSNKFPQLLGYAQAIFDHKKSRNFLPKTTFSHAVARETRGKGPRGVPVLA
jgi:hypothetical protein